MTISSQTRQAGPFTGNGVTTAFPFAFKVFAAANLQVVRTTPSGVDSTLTLTTDYTVSLNPDQDTNPGGTVTLPSALTSNWRLTITSGIDNLQPVELTNAGGFYPSVLNTALDRLTILVQQVSNQLGRALKIPISDGAEGAISTELPPADTRASRLLGFDGDGNLTTYTDISVSVVNVERTLATATAGQTLVNLSFTYTPGVNALSVYLNGAHLVRGTDYTETSSTSITLTIGAQLGDVIEVVGGQQAPTGSVDSSSVGYTPAGTGAVATSAQDKLRQSVSVFDFMTPAQQADVASGTGVLDVTAALAAAVAYVKLIPYSEKELQFPGGLYRVSQFDFTGVNFCTFRAIGTVQIYGNGTADFVFGCDGYVAGGDPDADSTFSNSNVFTGGGWLIANSGTYTHNFKFTAAVRCVFENFIISGNVGPASGANRIAASINFCWVNRFINFSVGTPGAPGAGYKSYNIAVLPLGGSNVNANTFEGCRIQAGSLGAPYTDSVGIYIAGGNTNVIRSCDISALGVGIELANSRGNVLEGNYFEYVTEIYRFVAGNSRGNVIIGGLHEVMTSGSAFNLTSSQNTNIIGGRYYGTSGGSSRTFINQGASCFGLHVSGPDLEDIDTYITGTYQGASTVQGPNIWQGQWLSFPPTQVASTDANTLDDYEEGTFNLGLSFGNGTTGITYSYRQGSYTKIGNVVHIRGSMFLSNKGSSTGAARITGLPFTIGNATNNYAPPSLYFEKVTFADVPSGYGEINGTTILLRETTNAGVATSLTDADFANDSFVVVSLSYRVG